METLGLIGRSVPTGPTHVEHLGITAAEELQLGFLEGPFNTEAEVTNYLGRDDWCAVRRVFLCKSGDEISSNRRLFGSSVDPYFHSYLVCEVAGYLLYHWPDVTSC